MFQFTIEGEENWQRAEVHVAEGLADLTFATQAGLEVLSRAVAQNVAMSGRPPYPDILPSSRATRRYDAAAPPLVDSGAMVEAATATRFGVEGSTYDIAAGGIVGQIGVEDLVHGAWRHAMGYGGPDSRGRMFEEPARDFMTAGEAQAGIVAVFDRALFALCQSVGVGK